MSTRGAIGWRLNGEYTCVYNHFDSYLEYLGIRMLILCGHITANNKWDIFKERISNITLITNESDTIPEEYLEKYAQYRDTEVNGDNGEHPTWYSVLRKLQGVGYFLEILKGNLEHLPDSTNFMYDSLFCEYAYTFNLDTMELEFWNGFQKKPYKKNPFGAEKTGGYYPVRKVYSIPFKDVVPCLVEISLSYNLFNILKGVKVQNELFEGDSKLAVLLRKITTAYEKNNQVQNNT